ncbi:MAG: hypothetical protein JWM93_1312 [Frankiales bacterium]|nr:hypothetical protein [Frankiales bacterium]
MDTQRLQELLTSLAECESADKRLTAVSAQLADDQAALAAQRDRLSAEERDVERLEHVSFARIVGRMRGHLDTDLDRERAEAEQCRLAVEHHKYAVARGEEDVAALRPVAARAPQLRSQIAAELASCAAGLDPADQRWPRTQALAELRASRTALLKEYDEAIRAARAALRALNVVASDLASAGSWSTYDTFFGGGLISSMVKHDRLATAAENAAVARDAVRRLSTELRDVGATDEMLLPAISEGLRMFDTWFDNIFSDMAVHAEIRGAQARVAELAQQISGIGRRLTDVLVPQSRAALAGIEAEQLALIVG